MEERTIIALLPNVPIRAQTEHIPLKIWQLSFFLDVQSGVFVIFAKH